MAMATARAVATTTAMTMADGGNRGDSRMEMAAMTATATITAAPSSNITNGTRQQ